MSGWRIRIRPKKNPDPVRPENALIFLLQLSIVKVVKKRLFYFFNLYNFSLYIEYYIDNDFGPGSELEVFLGRLMIRPKYPDSDPQPCIMVVLATPPRHLPTPPGHPSGTTILGKTKIRENSQGLVKKKWIGNPPTLGCYQW